jgi:hypothetical protein
MTQPLSDTDTNVLKPCPFCAGKAAMRHWEWPYERYQVRCSVCKALPSPGRFNTAEKAIAAWNTRPEQQNTDINAVTAEMLEAAWKSVNPPRLVNLDNKDLTAIYLAMSSASHPTKAPSPVAGDVVELIRARAKQRPSDGLIARQGVDETAIRYGQALLLALADEIEETIDRCAMCGCLLASKWTGDDEPHCPGCLAALEAIPSVDAGELTLETAEKLGGVTYLLTRIRMLGEAGETISFAHETLVELKIARTLSEARFGGAAEAVSKVVNRLRSTLAALNRSEP